MLHTPKQRRDANGVLFFEQGMQCTSETNILLDIEHEYLSESAAP